MNGTEISAGPGRKVPNEEGASPIRAEHSSDPHGCSSITHPFKRRSFPPGVLLSHVLGAELLRALAAALSPDEWILKVDIAHSGRLETSHFLITDKLSERLPTRTRHSASIDFRDVQNERRDEQRHHGHRRLASLV